ncbi:alcohol dehydrogenase [Talaromyces pinophilus]|nr:alcohol dehydrogenase [Talaromyces pinophilus]
MKAVVYTEKGTVEVLDRPKPMVKEHTDAVVRMLHASICGTDLHILRGDVPTVKPGLIMGHEGVGVIEALGSAVQGFQVGDRVIIACMTSCGSCRFCQRSIPSHCQSGGWTLGHRVDGTQAEFVRVPHATLSLHHLDSSVDTRAAVTLSDALPTGFECGVRNAGISPTSSVVIIGAGPVGIAALLTTCLKRPALIVVVDLDDARLETARTMGAHHTVNSAAPDVIQQLLNLTGNNGFDSVIEAVGIPATFEMCQELVAVGGQIANMGVHGVKVDLHMENLWDRNICIHMSMCNATSTPYLQNLVKNGELDIGSLVTHHFPVDQAMAAYDTFKLASKHRALKVAIDF